MKMQKSFLFLCMINVPCSKGSGATRSMESLDVFLIKTERFLELVATNDYRKVSVEDILNSIYKTTQIAYVGYYCGVGLHASQRITCYYSNTLWHLFPRPCKVSSAKLLLK